MPADEGSSAARAVWRIDRFGVPAAGRAEFLGRVAAIHDVLRRQAGFVRDAVLERPAGTGVSEILTVVEWESEQATGPATAAVRELNARTGFDRAEMLSRLGITADFGLYRPVGT